MMKMNLSQPRVSMWIFPIDQDFFVPGRGMMHSLIPTQLFQY